MSPRGLGRSRGGLGLGPRVFGGVAVGCVGRNTVLLDLILSLGVRRQHTLVFLNTPPCYSYPSRPARGRRAEKVLVHADSVGPMSSCDRYRIVRLMGTTYFVGL